MWRYYQVVWGNPDDAVDWLDNSMHSGRPGPGRSVAAQLLSLHGHLTLSSDACTLDLVGVTLRALLKLRSLLTLSRACSRH